MGILLDFKNTLNKKGMVCVKVKVRAGAAKTEVRGEMAGGTIKIDIAAPPEKDKANRALIRFLAREFAVLPENVRIIRGARERIKLINIKQAI